MGLAFGLIVGFLVLILIGSVTVLLRTAFIHHDHQESAQQKAVAELAHQQGGTVTLALVAQHLGVTAAQADRILRGMVDDTYFKMAVDDEAGCLVFWYPEMTGTEVPGHLSRYSRVRRPTTRDLEPMA